MQLDKIKTINDLIAYCRGVLGENPEYMLETDQIPYAAAIVGLYSLSEYDAFEAEYSEITEILDLASNLEIPNSDNTTIDWRRIRELVEQLDREIKQ